MSDWFAKLMQRGHEHARRVVVKSDVPSDATVTRDSSARDVRYDSIVQRLRDRMVEERDEREKRHRWYRQSLTAEATTQLAAENTRTRLYKLSTKVPCRVTPAAQALLEQFRKRYAGCTVSFSQLPNRRQALMLTSPAGAMRRQVGWVEHCVQTNPEHCNVRSQGLSVETDDGSMLVLRFSYPSTSVRMSSALASSGSDELKYQDFAEIRPALDLHPAVKESSPRLVWITRPEAETMNALQSREYEAFYLRLKLAVQAGVWSTLSSLLSTLPATQWKCGSCYTVVREPEASTRKIHQRTVDDSGRRIDIGQDRTYDAAPATDILLLHLDGDILADFADVYFTLQGLSSTDAYFLKEEFFTIIRRFWTGAQSLTSRYGGDLSALMRMSQGAVPMPAQAPMLKQDWTNLRQCLIDRYGEGGRKAADLISRERLRVGAARLDWPFSAFPAGEVNIGLRVVYRQAWRYIGAQRGEVIRTLPLGASSDDRQSTCVTATERGQQVPSLETLVNDVTKATVDLMRWPTDLDGSIHMGLRDLAARSDMEAENRESSRDIGLRLAEIASKCATDIVERRSAVAHDTITEIDSSLSIASETEKVDEQEAATRVYRRLRDVYEVVTRPAEIQNVVLVAEQLPAPAEIDRSWVMRHERVLARVLLDESFRDALETIGVECKEQPAPLPQDAGLEAKRDRFYDHLRSNILHYQRAIWQQEDPQQRSMRYRKSGKKVPLEWQFELESGSELTIDELGERLSAANVEGHFAAYSGGKEADLDRLIDPAGLLGYHGNYAVFRMRPELRAEDMFSMLHFFKSPYLYRNPETGEPVVDDPARIRMCENALVGSNDGKLLFHQERARTIALKSEGIVVDIIRSTPAKPSVEVAKDVDAAEAPVRYELILENTADPLLISNIQRESKGESSIVLAVHGEQERLCTAPGISDYAHADTAATGIFAGACGRPSSALCVGRSCESKDSQGILARSEAPMASLVTGVGTRDGERVIEASVDDARCLGTPHDCKAESGIVTRNDRISTVAPAVHRAAATDEQVGISLGDDEGRTGFPVGRGRAIVEPVIREPGSGGLRISSITGGGAARAHERVILAAGDAQSTPSLVAGAGASSEYEHMVLAQDDEWLRPSLVVG